MNLHAIDLRDAVLPHELRERLCWLYYEEIYKPAFPIADEAEDPTVWLPLISGVAPLPSPIVHLVLAVSDNCAPQEISAAALLGGIIFEYFRTSKSALATYMCVRPEVRGHGVAKFLLRNALDVIRSHTGGGSVPLFAEAEKPDEQTDAPARALARQRLPILSQLGFRKVPIVYRQPALGPGKHALDNLEFLVFTGGEEASIKLWVLRGFMREFYESLDAGQPDEARMFAGLTGDTVATLALTDHK